MQIGWKRDEQTRIMEQIDRMPLSGKVVLITGASRGIGAAAAKRLAQWGASVVINYHQSRDRALEVLKEQGVQITVSGYNKLLTDLGFRLGDYKCSAPPIE